MLATRLSTVKPDSIIMLLYSTFQLAKFHYAVWAYKSVELNCRTWSLQDDTSREFGPWVPVTKIPASIHVKVPTKSSGTAYTFRLGMCFLALPEKKFWLDKTKVLELTENVFVLKWIIGTADVKTAIYCGKFAQMVWQGIHHVLLLSRAGKKAVYFFQEYIWMKPEVSLISQVTEVPLLRTFLDTLAQRWSL